VYAFSELQSISFEKIIRGEIIGIRTPLDGTELSLGAESFYAVRLAPDPTLQKMKTFSTTDMEEGQNLSVKTSHAVSNPAVNPDFNGFALNPSFKNSAWFLKQSAKSLSGGVFNLSHQEKTLLAAAMKNSDPTDPEQTREFTRVWREILTGRAGTFQKSGLIGSTPYENAGQHFEHGKETLRALKSRPKVLQAFSGILDPVMTGKPLPNAPAPHFTWEMSDIRKEQTLSLTAFFSQPSEGGHRVAEVTYFVTSQYYLSVILYQLIPVEIDGLPGTFIYRSDFVLSPSVSRIKGIERIAAENILLMEIRKSIRSFVQHCEADY
jgi:hypothetical protein